MTEIEIKEEDIRLGLVYKDEDGLLWRDLEIHCQPTERAEQLKQQILRDQKNVKEFRHQKPLLVQALQEAQKYRQIVKRLEERFDELRRLYHSIPADGSNNWDQKEKYIRVFKEFEKILKGK